MLMGPQSSAASQTQQTSPAAIYFEISDEIPIHPPSPTSLPPASTVSNYSFEPSTFRGPSPAPPIPITPQRQRQPLVFRALATPPASRRRLRSTTPATLQSAASLRRSHVRARRRHAPTPFERAASEFAAIELRRLENESRHTEVLNSLVNVAAGFLECYHSSIRERNTE